MARWARHGDLSFHKVAELPRDAKKIASKVLAEGEVSGHMHVLQGDAQIFMQGGNRYLEVGAGGAVIQHVDQFGGLTGEHDTIQIQEPGVFVMQQERESDLSGNDRSVVD